MSMPRGEVLGYEHFTCNDQAHPSERALTDGHSAKGHCAWELIERERGHSEEGRATHDDALLHLMVWGKT